MTTFLRAQVPHGTRDSGEPGTTGTAGAAATGGRTRLVVLQQGARAAVLLAWLALGLGVLLDAGESASAVLLPLTTVTSAAAVLLRAATVPAARVPWTLLGLALSGYGLGFLVLLHISSGDGAVFGLNSSDALSLLLYPFGYAGLVGLTRSAGAARRPGSTTDAAVVLLAPVALALAWAGITVPTLLQGDFVNVVYALAYAVGGFTLLMVCLAGLVASRAAWDPTWTLAAGALALMTLGDALYGIRAAEGTFAFGTPVDLLYTAGPAGLALAAWQCVVPVEPTARAARLPRDDWPAVLLPSVAGVAAVGVLTVQAAWPLPRTAVVAACLAGLASVLRAANAMRQERLLEQTLREVSLDALTGLHNRRALTARMDQVLDEVMDHGPTDMDVHLVVVDLDGLDELRDSLGGHVADGVLRAQANRLRSLALDGLAARLRGNGLAVLLPGTCDAAAAHALVLRDALEMPVDVYGHRLVLRPSLGAARHPGDSTHGEWLRRADVALRAARALASRVGIYHEALDAEARERLGRVSELRAALEDHPDQLVVHYQGKHRPFDGRLHTAEALIRWQHPVDGLLPPFAFLPAAEQAGLLPQITQHVLRTVLTDAQHVRPTRPDWQVSVNICADDLLDPDFVRLVRDLLAQHHLPADVLRLEVTETVVMTDPARTIQALDRLAELGVGLSLDDYGTGLASLAYLRDLPVDELKIDRSFVRDLLQNTTDELIVASTVQLAHGLGLTVVAEGAEDDVTVTRLHQMHCDTVQGYALSRPTALGTLLAGDEAHARLANTAP